jgi:hypothetical protein
MIGGQAVAPENDKIVQYPVLDRDGTMDEIPISGLSTGDIKSYSLRPAFRLKPVLIFGLESQTPPVVHPALFFAFFSLLDLFRQTITVIGLLDSDEFFSLGFVKGGSF